MVTDTVERVTGRAPMSVRQWIEAHREELDHVPKISDRIAGTMLRARYRKDRLTDS